MTKMALESIFVCKKRQITLNRLPVSQCFKGRVNLFDEQNVFRFALICSYIMLCEWPIMKSMLGYIELVVY